MATPRQIIAAVILSTSFSALPARADSIYLKSGRIIRSAVVYVDGDRVIFLQHGANQAIPLNLVERVETDDFVGPGNFARRPVTPTSVSANDRAVAIAGDDRGDEGARSLAGTGVEARMQALSRMMAGGGSGIDPGEALAMLQGLGGLGDNSSGGLAALAPLLGALSGSGGAGAFGGLAAMGADLDKVQHLLPSLTQLGAALFAPEYSAENTHAAARRLLSGLSALGVSNAEIRAKAKQFGISDKQLDQLLRR